MQPSDTETQPAPRRASPARKNGVDAPSAMRILDAAERLFMEFGFTATSMRLITSEAKVNLASVNYYFGSKEALIEAVLKRRLAPLNQERVRQLDELESAGRVPSVEEILRAFVGAALQLSRDPREGGQLFLRLLGRAITEPNESVRALLQQQYDETAMRYRQALSRALPHMPTNELIWRMHFMFGAISYTMAGTDVMKLIASCDTEDANDFEAVTRRLVAFLLGGLQAPASHKE